MRLNGKHKFNTSSQQVFNTILDPVVLKSCIPGCNSIGYLDPKQMSVNIVTPLPGLKGPYSIIITITQRQEPDLLVLEVHRKGTGGSMDGVCRVFIKDEDEDTLLTYNVTAELEGPIAIVNNPIGEGIVKNLLNNFFKKLDKVFE